jgi:HSP20 family protein
MLPAVRNGVHVQAPVNRLSTLFDRFFNDEFFAPTSQAWAALPLAMWQDDHSIHAEVDVPGLTDQDVEVSVHQGELLIQGERKCERQQPGFDSRSYGRFEQRISLPCAVETDRIEAKLQNGVLSLTLPKSEAAKPRKIALKSQ